MNMCYMAMCKNLPGSFECYCEDGYVMDGSKEGSNFEGLVYEFKSRHRPFFLTLFECVDKNECNDNTCLDKSSKCVNIPGSFYCSCVDGFEKNSTGICVPATCTKKSCSHNAYCSNDKCTCLPGWTGNGIFCERTLGWCKVKKIFTMINK